MPPTCDYPLTLAGIQCLGLQQAQQVVGSRQCARRCCSDPDCEVWQWCPAGGCQGAPAGTCWIGSSEQCYFPSRGFVSGARPTRWNSSCPAVLGAPRSKWAVAVSTDSNTGEDILQVPCTPRSQIIRHESVFPALKETFCVMLSSRCSSYESASTNCVQRQTCRCLLCIRSTVGVQAGAGRRRLRWLPVRTPFSMWPAWCHDACSPALRA